MNSSSQEKKTRKLEALKYFQWVFKICIASIAFPSCIVGTIRKKDKMWNKKWSAMFWNNSVQLRIYIKLCSILMSICHFMIIREKEAQTCTLRKTFIAKNKKNRKQKRWHLNFVKITVPNMFLYLSFLETSQAQLSSYAHLHGNYLQVLQIQIQNLIFTKHKHSAFLKYQNQPCWSEHGCYGNFCGCY